MQQWGNCNKKGTVQVQMQGDEGPWEAEAKVGFSKAWTFRLTLTRSSGGQSDSVEFSFQDLDEATYEGQGWVDLAFAVESGSPTRLLSRDGGRSLVPAVHPLPPGGAR